MAIGHFSQVLLLSLIPLPRHRVGAGFAGIAGVPIGHIELRKWMHDIAFSAVFVAIAGFSPNWEGDGVGLG